MAARLPLKARLVPARRSRFHCQPSASFTPVPTTDAGIKPHIPTPIPPYVIAANRPTPKKTAKTSVADLRLQASPPPDRM